MMGPRRRTRGTCEEGAAKKAARRHMVSSNNCILVPVLSPRVKLMEVATV